MRMKLFAAAALLAATAIPASAQQQPWKITALLPITGPLAGYAIEFKAGIDYAVEDINAAGGIKGRPIQLETYDTQNNPGQIATLTRKACDESLLVVTSLSAEAQIALPIANSMKCPAFAGSAAAPGLTSKDRPYNFATMSPTNVSTPLAVDIAYKALKPKTSISFLERQDPSANAYGTMTSEALVKNGVKDEVVTVNNTDVDFGPAMSRAMANGAPDMIVISAMERSVLGLLKEFRKSEAKSRVFLTMSAYNANIGAQPPEVMEGVYRFALSDPELSMATDPRAKRIVERFKAKNNGKPPTLSATNTYDTILYIADVIAKSDMTGDPAARDADRTKLIEGMMKVKDFDGVTGRLTMTENRYMTATPIVLVYKGGKWEQVK